MEIMSSRLAWAISKSLFEKKNRELRLNKKGHKEKEFQILNSQQMQASDKYKEITAKRTHEHYMDK
jgi:transposase